MIWFKKKQEDVSVVDQARFESVNEDPPNTQLSSVDQSVKIKPSFLKQLKSGLSKTRHHLGSGLFKLLLGKQVIDADLLMDLEALLLSADLGIDITTQLLQDLSSEVTRKQVADGDVLLGLLKNKLLTLLTTSPSSGPDLPPQTVKPWVVLMVGVNGAGKTTTIGKLAQRYRDEGKQVMLAAGDTFRAAAIEQLQVWGERNQIPVIAQHTGADSASVIYDAFVAAQHRGMDVLIADTAGRLHTQSNLMNELKKVKRVLQKIDPTAPHETMLVLDASIGQNALNQAREFHEAIGLTGIIMTKLDGTAKGGIVFSIAQALGIPFRYLGFGEKLDDLQPFDASQFVDAIFDDDHM